MIISINGTSYDLEEGSTVTQALIMFNTDTTSGKLGLNEFVVALNQTFIPRSQYLHTELQNDDAIELLSPMAGG